MRLALPQINVSSVAAAFGGRSATGENLRVAFSAGFVHRPVLMGMNQPALNKTRFLKVPPAWWLGGLLAASVILAYWPVGGYAFIDFDDNDYVWRNPQVTAGVTWPGIAWAFTHFFKGNWHPVTWLSHMLDVQLYGLSAGGHHLTNLIFHVANTLLLFLWLARITGFVGRSAMVAALFGLHPLHVESVAWVSERKDVLSTFFMFLALLAYTRYVKGRIQNSEASPKIYAPFSIFYLLCLGCFALGLMSKPMLVTLPFVLLLLDHWPLNRFQVSGFKFQVWKPLLVEKIPFFILSAVSCVITLLAQRSGNAVMPVKFLPLEGRLENTVVSYAHYLGKLFWPEHLAAYYPLKFPIPAAEIILAVSVLVILSLSMFLRRRQCPWLVTGWLWYLGTLVPVIGLVQVGSQSMADRYTYIPLIGIFIALVWLVAEMSSGWPHRRVWLAVLSVSLLVACWMMTVRQVRSWQNSEMLARHGILVTTDNPVMHGLLGTALFAQGKMKQAGDQFARAAAIWPDSVTAQCGLAMSLVQQGRQDEAVAACLAVLKYRPAAAQVHDLLASLYSKQGKWVAAAAEHETTVQLDPENPVYLNNFAWFLATVPDDRSRDGSRAVRLAEEACRLTNYQGPMFIGTLAAAQAEAGQFEEAVANARDAIALATKLRNHALVRKNLELLELYQQKKPYHEPLSH